ncbi:MAG: diguanylate cyclase [Rhodocyclaceae bacterium]|nr:diguanylate cyclase [Rhodocyclaceae bacterium]
MPLHPSPRNAWQFFLLIAVAVLALAWGVAAEHVADMRRETHAAAARHAQAMAAAHVRQTTLTLAVAEEALHHLRTTLANEGTAAFQREAARISARGAGGPIDRVALVDAGGRMLANYLDGQPGALADMSDREYFHDIRRRGEDRLHVTEPFRGRFTGEWIVLFSRPLLRDGSFAGIVQVGLSAARLGDPLGAVDGDRETVTLLSPGNRIVARSSGPEFTGRPADLPPGSGEAPSIHNSPLDGVRRLVVVRAVPDTGMRVAAAVDMLALDHDIAGHTRVAFLPAILLTLLLLPASLLIRRAGLGQQAAHEALQAETERSRTVFETMGEGILLLDAGGRIEFANVRVGAWLPEARGLHFADAVHAAGFTLVTEDGRAFADDDPLARFCLAAGQDVDDVWLRRRDDGGDVWLALKARAFRDADGAVRGATLTLADRSEEHERLTESALTAGIIEGMQDSVMITDARGRILRVNPAFTELTGFSADAAVGRTPAILKSERHDDAFFAAMWRALLDTGQWSGRVWNRRPSGEEYCVWHNVTSVRDVHGRIARFITASRDITEQEAREGELWLRANFDPLTGLANRARFADRLTQALVNAQRDGRGFAVCYLDLDHFKPVNDTLGHAAGDALLRQVAQRMRSTLREEDTLARIGGDEFALLLPHTRSDDDAARVAAKIIDLVNAPFELAEGTANVGISIGIARFPDDGDDAAALHGAADLALYAAKNGGRNCWRFAGAAADDRAGA